MEKKYLKIRIISLLFPFLLPFFLKAQSNTYANLLWKDVQDGAAIGQRGIQVVDLNNDGKQEVLASGRLISTWFNNEHFFIYDYFNGQYRRKWDSKMYEQGGIHGMLAAKIDGDDDYEICVVSAYNLVEIYDGTTLNVIDSFNIPAGEVLEIAIDNVDATPDKELILVGRNGLKVYSLTTKQLKWEVSDIKGSDVKVGDLDNDGKKEIVIRGFESAHSLYVLDAYTKTTKWTLDMPIGNIFLYDVNADGFLDIVAQSANGIDYIHSVTHRPITLVTNSGFSFSGIYYVGDIDNDGQAEVLIGTYGGGVIGFHFNGVQMGGVGGSDYGLMRFAVGDTDGDGKMDIVRGTSANSSGDQHLYINDFATKALKFGNSVNKGFSTFGIRDIDNDGYLNLVMANSVYLAPTTNFANRPQGRLENYNLRNRQKTKTSYYPYVSPQDQFPIRAIGQSRDKRKKEVATDYGVYDALTHEAIYDAVVAYNNSKPILSVFKFADVDNDSIDELMTNEVGLFKVYKFQQDSYRLAWEIPLPGPAIFLDLVVKNIDSDTASELITVNSFGKVTIYDTQTKAIEWQSNAIRATCLDVADVDLDGKMDIIIGNDNGEITILDGQTKQEKKHIYAFSFTLRKVQAINLDTTPSLEIIALEDDVKIFNSRTGDVLWDMPDEYDEVYPETFSIEAHDVDRDGYMELYFSNQNGLFVFGINQPVKNGRVATQELPHFPLTCAPNPSSGLFELSFEPQNMSKIALEVINTEGGVVFQQNIERTQNGLQKHILDLHHLPSGLFVLCLKTSNEVAYQKLIISK